MCTEKMFLSKYEKDFQYIKMNFKHYLSEKKFVSNMV